MGLFKKDTRYNKCAYCKTKNYANIRYCSNCGLDFSQIDDCSNKEAKKALLHRRFGESFDGEIVNVSKYPKDVSKKKYILLTIFLGFLGFNNLYIGKFVRGIISFVLGLVFTTCVIIVTLNIDLANGVANLWFSIGLFVGVFPTLSWLTDIFDLVFKKSTFPIMLKSPVDIVDEDDE